MSYKGSVTNKTMEHLPTLIHNTVDIMEFNHQNYINHSPTIPWVQWVIVENSHSSRNSSGISNSLNEDQCS